ncbi:hypothetical protein BDF21DRAFT_413752 [Thamnidium elegans]|nr:hypothetical protein BDF21DRAFT_413752 [Thamnidium elegans]
MGVLFGLRLIWCHSLGCITSSFIVFFLILIKCNQMLLWIRTFVYRYLEYCCRE